MYVFLYLGDMRKWCVDINEFVCSIIIVLWNEWWDVVELVISIDEWLELIECYGDEIS